MKFLQLDSTTKLSQLRETVGTSNLESVLAVNSLKRTPNIGAQLTSRTRDIMRSNVDVTTDFKVTSLNRAIPHSDIFESMALMDSGGWKVYKEVDALPNTLRIPDEVNIPSSIYTLGNNIKVSDLLYRKTIEGISVPPHEVDPSIFSIYSSDRSPKIINTQVSGSNDVWEFAKIPWGKMTIYSSIANASKDFPVYPDEISDNVVANYTTMPELIYQYEPWQLYTSSGPRTVTYSFSFHRDMWTGDHRDGKANELIRFCMANCYPEYNGSAVNSSYSTLYMNGQILIRGVITDVQVQWSGPLGVGDDFYLFCRLSLTFIEVSPYALDYWTVMNKPLIG